MGKEALGKSRKELGSKQDELPKAGVVGSCSGSLGTNARDPASPYNVALPSLASLRLVGEARWNLLHWRMDRTAENQRNNQFQFEFQRRLWKCMANTTHLGEHRMRKSQEALGSRLGESPCVWGGGTELTSWEPGQGCFQGSLKQ